MFSQINDPIEVVAFMKAGEIRPLKLLWHGREVVIKIVNLSWSRWEGRSKIYYFAVSDSTDYFKLRFDTDKLSWTLLESYIE